MIQGVDHRLIEVVRAGDDVVVEQALAFGFDRNRLAQRVWVSPAAKRFRCLPRSPRGGQNPCIAQLFQRPTTAMRLTVEPQLASWDAAASASQQRLGLFLTHVEAVAAPMMAGAQGRLAVELTVGLAACASLTSGGRDLDNYLYPLAKRLGAGQLAAVFGRKMHGTSWLAVNVAQPHTPAEPPHFSTRMSAHTSAGGGRAELRDRLRRARLDPLRPGPVAMDVAMTTGPGRNWSNVWKPLIDSLGPILGEDPRRPFHPADERITRLGLHHNIDHTVGHDVIVELWLAGIQRD
jgi:hypothetical protein